MNEQTDIKELIIKEIAKTERLIIEYKDMTQPVAPDVAIGRISRMDAINNQSVTEASLRQAQQKLSHLKHALDKCGTPDFGVCIKCKNQIPIQRILIRPQSLHCVKCAG